MKNYLSEYLGTFVLVYCGTGAITIDEVTKGSIIHLEVAMSFGLIVMAMIYTFGNKFGAHLNPAVTIAFATHSTFDKRAVVPYISSQFSGAIAASYSLKYLFPGSLMLGATIPAGSELPSFILECILRFLLMLVILNVAHGSKEQGLFAGTAIGVVALEAIFAGPICGAWMNPARYLSPALAGGHFQSRWLYFAAPILGMLSSTAINKLNK